MQITWFGHSCFRIDTGESSILIDPFLTGNSDLREIRASRVRRGGRGRDPCGADPWS